MRAVSDTWVVGPPVTNIAASVSVTAVELESSPMPHQEF